MKLFYVFLLLTILTISNKSYSQDDFPVLKGPYLGQTPPGITAEAFAPGIISTKGWEIEGSFAPGMKEFYFTTKGGKYTHPPLLASGRKTISRRSIWNSRGSVKSCSRLTASACIWRKVTRTVSEMAGQNAKALARCLTAKTGVLCACRHPLKAPMFLTIIKART